MIRLSWPARFFPASRNVATPHLQFGGQGDRRKNPIQRGNPDPLAPLLTALSWKYVTQDAKFESYKYPEYGSEKMKEQLGHWVGRIWIHQNKWPTGAKLRSFEILKLEPEFRDYITKHGPELFDYGITVEETWASQQLYSADPIVLFLSKRFEGEATTRITRKKILESEVLVWLLAALCFELDIDRPVLQVMTTNGQSGHNIAISGLNGVDFVHPRGDTHIPRGWFSFHDPWPARSLLASKQKFPLIDVFEDVSQPPFWLISPDDLERVIVGFAVPSSLMPAMHKLLSTVDLVKKHRRDGRTPLWIENPMEPEQPFFAMLAMHGGKTPTTFASLVGLAQLNLLIKDVDNARVLLREAYAVRPTSETRASFVSLLTHFGHMEPAKEWG